MSVLNTAPSPPSPQHSTHLQLFQPHPHPACISYSSSPHSSETSILGPSTTWARPPGHEMYSESPSQHHAHISRHKQAPRHQPPPACIKHSPTRTCISYRYRSTPKTHPPTTPHADLYVQQRNHHRLQLLQLTSTSSSQGALSPRKHPMPGPITGTEQPSPASFIPVPGSHAVQDRSPHPRRIVRRF